MRNALTLLILLALVGCSSTGNLGAVSRSMGDPGALYRQETSYREIGPASGRACRYFLLGVIPWGDATVQAAVDEALKEKGGDAMINVSVQTGLYGFVPIYNIFCFTCTHVQGIAIEFERPAELTSEVRPPLNP
jgi:hypothetical protein